MRTHLTIAAILAIAIASATAQPGLFDDPFGATASLSQAPDGTQRLVVAFQIPQGHYLYADALRVTPDEDAKLRLLDRPEPTQKHDPFSDGERDVFLKPFQATYNVERAANGPLPLTIEYQGCSEQLCYIPASYPIALTPGATQHVGTIADSTQKQPATTEAPPTAPPTPDDGNTIAPNFAIVASSSGYQKAEPFLEFLREARMEGIEEEELLDMGLWLMILTVLIGGLLLNLTPCVLPMIPINLAIIGAGAQASSRARGFALGGVYGAAIALTYGALGLVVVLTGATFGTLNANPWFNFAIAAVFIVLALAMFDVIHIDFTRFRKAGPAAPSRRGSFALAFGMGIVAALLAGACVAPVVISVLLASAKLYAGGSLAGLLLPFLLGAGMALPWPFAGASLSFLPKPGRWMNWVKIAFGIFILVFALYYGRLGYRLLAPRATDAEASEIAAIQKERTEHGAWLTSLPQALEQSRQTGKPILIDFWATWCKNCLHMEQTTFRDPDVIGELESFVLLKFQAEQPKAPDTQPILARFGALGLPTYVVLKPVNDATDAAPERKPTP